MRDYRIYDLQMRFLGFLNAEHPQAPDFPWVNPPHPMVTPVYIPKTRRTRYLMVTFSGNAYPNLGEFGELVVQDARSSAWATSSSLLRCRPASSPRRTEIRDQTPRNVRAIRRNGAPSYGRKAAGSRTRGAGGGLLTGRCLARRLSL
ncbi:MAG: hypothetical protein WKF72_06430 [Nocardioidaceae bacterium]